MDRNSALSISDTLLLCFVRFVSYSRSLVFVNFSYILVKISLKTETMSMMLRKPKGWL